jgi:SAM-dependent methyltransferase
MADPDAAIALTRKSWNEATRAHNAHKGDQAAALRAGSDPLFPEELVLLGDLTGRRLVHLQCNSGQDSLGLARRGAAVVGVDLSDEAVAFARALSAESGIAATFVEAEIVDWMHTTDERFDIAFASYGAPGWIPDLRAWMRGARRILRPGGALVIVEFHPLVWSWAGGPTDVRPTGDDYFADAPFVAPVGDYVAASGEALGAATSATPATLTTPATSWQHTTAQILGAVLDAGLVLARVDEHPHANGCRVVDALVPGPGRTWTWPPGVARTPLMLSLRAVAP